MGFLSVQRSIDEVTPYIDEILSTIIPKTDLLLDGIADIEVDYMRSFNPIGETQQLNDLTMWEVTGHLARYIFSGAGHFEPIVNGHIIMGPFLTEKQRRWWFWFLNNVLGGVYDVKHGTGNKTPPNDYPTEALNASSDDVDSRCLDYLDDLFGT